MAVAPLPTNMPEAQDGRRQHASADAAPELFDTDETEGDE